MFVSYHLSSLKQRALGIDPANDIVGYQDDGKAHDALEEPDRAGLGEVETVHHGPIYVGFNDIRGGEKDRVIAYQVVKQAEVAAQDAADREQEQDNHRGAEAGQRDVADALESVGAVNLCGFKQGFVDAGDGREINHRAIARGLPQMDKDDDEGPGGRPAVE